MSACAWEAKIRFLNVAYFCIMVWLIVGWGQVAEAEKRVALVIGNGAYKNAPTLANPKNDAEDMAAALRALGFTVVLGVDLNRAAMERKIREFASELIGADAGVFHYSGHGLQFRGLNYLISVDADITTPDALDFEAIPLDLILRTMEREAKTNILFLDACRDNPFTRSLARALGTRAAGIGQGLAPAELGMGTLISFSTQPGNVALDGSGRNSPYSGPLSKTIGKQGEDILSILTSVRNEVLAATNEKQVPWENNALRAKFFFNPTMPAQSPTGSSEVAQVWVAVQNTTSEAVLEEFIRRFPDSVYAAFARARLDELRKVKQALELPQHEPTPQEATKDACDRGLLVSVAHSSVRPCIKPGSGDSFKDCSNCPEMIVVPSGTFKMGSPENEPGRSDAEGPQHNVSIAKPFAVGKFTITLKEFEVFAMTTGHEPDRCDVWDGHKWVQSRERSYRSPGFEQTDSDPVVCVNWDDAKAYVDWLSKRTDKVYRLLSEAEQEYVTRAGISTPFWWGASITPKDANYDSTLSYQHGAIGDCPQKTMPVKSFKPNLWGLYQVHGNVWSWMKDCEHTNYIGAPGDGSPWESGNCNHRVIRGGAWDANPRDLRSAHRETVPRSIRGNSFGFRVARAIVP